VIQVIPATGVLPYEQFGFTNCVRFKDVLYLTSAAFRVLLVATDEAERNAARVVLCGLLGQVRELFEMGGLLEAFTVHSSREDALASL